jgi:hypothetical protein
LLLDILCRGLAAEWEKIRIRFQDPAAIADKELNTSAAAVILEPMERLNDYLAEKIINLLYGYLLKPPQLRTDEDTNQFAQKAGRCLFYVSGIHPDAAFTKLTSVIQTGPNEKEEPTNQYLAIEHLNLNKTRLAGLLEKASKSLQLYTKKTNLQILLTRVIRRAIWNWIDNYPVEFGSLAGQANAFAG